MTFTKDHLAKIIVDNCGLVNGRLLGLLESRGRERRGESTMSRRESDTPSEKKTGVSSLLPEYMSQEQI